MNTTLFFLIEFKKSKTITGSLIVFNVPQYKKNVEKTVIHVTSIQVTIGISFQ